MNYANKYSDTNLDEDAEEEELAEGGIVHVLVEVEVPAPPFFPSSPLSSPLYLEAGAYLISCFF